MSHLARMQTLPFTLKVHTMLSLVLACVLSCIKWKVNRMQVLHFRQQFDLAEILIVDFTNYCLFVCLFAGNEL